MTANEVRYGYFNRPSLGLDYAHYDDGATYDYDCYAMPGTPLTSEEWYVVRRAKNMAGDGRLVAHAIHATKGYGAHFAATSLLVVAALTYTT